MVLFCYFLLFEYHAWYSFIKVLILFSDTNGTQILIKIAKGGWLSVLKNIYNNDKELLRVNSNLTNKSEFYFSLNLYEIAQQHPIN